MSLQEQLLNKVIELQKARAENPQKVLDSQYFHDLPLEEKVNFINQHKDWLSVKPKYDWGSVPTGAATAGLLATSGTLMHQITNKIGNGGFKPNYWALGGAAVMGALVGGAVSASRAKQDYNRDVRTQRSIDDAISVLVNRSMMKAPTKTDYMSRIKSTIEDAPLTYGKTLSDIDFDSLDKH
jgi:hypothetical protein